MLQLPVLTVGHVRTQPATPPAAPDEAETERGGAHP